MVKKQTVQQIKSYTRILHPALFHQKQSHNTIPEESATAANRVPDPRDARMVVHSRRHAMLSPAPTTDAELSRQHVNVNPKTEIVDCQASIAPRGSNRATLRVFDRAG